MSNRLTAYLLSLDSESYRKFREASVIQLKTLIDLGAGFHTIELYDIIKAIKQVDVATKNPNPAARKKERNTGKNRSGRSIRIDGAVKSNGKEC